MDSVQAAGASSQSGEPFLRSGRLAFVVALVLLLAGCPNALALRTEPAGPDFVTATFTWNNGVGGLSWDASPQTETVGGPAVSRPPGVLPDEAGFWTPACNLDYKSNPERPRNCPTITVEFTSEPVSRRLVVNVSKLIQVDLFDKASSAQPRIEVWMGSTFVAGSVASGSLNPSPKVPQGFTLKAFRLQSEVEVIPAGATLLVRLVYVDTHEVPRYSLGPGQRSEFRVPTYTDDEVFFRYKGTLESSATKTDVGSAGSGNETSMLAFLASPWLSRPRKRPAVLLLLLLVSSGLAGCVNGPGSDSSNAGSGEQLFGGSIDASVVRDNHTNLTSEFTGSLLGLVIDDLERPVVGARASLPGTSFFGDTNAGGRFVFKGVRPGSYNLRIEHVQYKVFEGAVSVYAESVTRADIVLEPLLASGLRPHRHDGWDRADMAIVMDQDTQGPCFRWEVYSFYYYPIDFRTGVDRTVCGSGWTVVPPLKRGGAPNLISPGTREVEITITSDAPGKPTRYGLVFKSNYDPTNESSLYPRQVGTPLHLKTNWEMTDVGHQEFSLWSFGITVDDAAWYNSRHELEEPWPVHVKMVIHRGVLPIEAEHRDFWGQNMTMQVHWDDWTPVWENDQTYGATQKLVPPGTKWLEFTAQTASAKSLYDVQRDKLRYRTANLPTSCTQAECFKTARAQSFNDDRKFVWNVPLNETETDPYYAKVPNFWFWQGISDPNDYQLAALTDESRTYNMTVVAHRDAFPSAS